jgi:hypothetical protein
MDLSRALGTVDAIQTAKLRNQMSNLAMEDAEQQRAWAIEDRATAQQDRARNLADEGALRSARTGAWGGDKAAMGQLVALAPNEAAAIEARFKGMADEERTRAAAEAKEEIDAMGRVLMWVKAAPDPAKAWATARENLPEEWAAKLPQEYSPDMVEFFLVRTMETDQVLDMVAGDRASRAITGAMSPNRAAPRGRQGELGALPGGDDHSGMPLGAGLTGSESGGNWQAQNDVMGAGGRGHFGRGQFSIARLQDAKNAGVIPQDMSPEQFMADPNGQMAVEQWHRGDIFEFVQQKGLDRYLGQEIGGVPVTEQGLLNVAHLGGKGGLERFLTTGGQYNPADANGTKLSDYLEMGAREGGGPNVDPGVSSLMAMAAGGGIDDKQREILMAAAEILQGPKPQSPEGKLYADQQAGLAPAAGPAFDREQEVRKEFTALPPVKDFQSQADAMSRIAASASEPSPAGDLSLIFAYMKMLDPGSAVKEAEFNNAEIAAPLLERFGISFDKVASVWEGQKLTEGQRADFVSRAQDIYGKAEGQFNAIAEQYRAMAEAEGLDVTRTIPTFGYGGEMPEMPTDDPMASGSGGRVKVMTVEEYNALPSGTPYEDMNGIPGTKR